ncbi:hypothetical protein RFI_12280, partial [Reticulomyxa filosa]
MASHIMWKKQPDEFKRKSQRFNQKKIYIYVYVYMLCINNKQANKKKKATTDKMEVPEPQSFSTFIDPDQWDIVIDTMAASIHPEEQLKVFSKLRKIAEKMLQQDDPKYRSLYLNNPQLQKSLLVYDGGLEFLYNLGYIPTREDNQKLVCHRPNARVVNACLVCLSDKIDSLRNETAVSASSSSAVPKAVPTDDSGETLADIANTLFLPDEHNNRTNGKNGTQLLRTQTDVADANKKNNEKTKGVNANANTRNGGNGAITHSSKSMAIPSSNDKADTAQTSSQSLPQSSQNKTPNKARNPTRMSPTKSPTTYDDADDISPKCFDLNFKHIPMNDEPSKKEVQWRVIILIRHGNSYWNSQKNDGSSIKKWTAVGRGLIEMIGGTKNHSDSVVVDAPLSKNGIDEAFGLSKYQHNQTLIQLQKVVSPVKDAVRVLQTQLLDDQKYQFSKLYTYICICITYTYICICITYTYILYCVYIYANLKY